MNICLSMDSFQYVINMMSQIKNDSVDGRAAQLVDIIQTRVQLNHQNYDKFICALNEAGSDNYKDILTLLSKTVHEGNYGNRVQLSNFAN